MNNATTANKGDKMSSLYFGGVPTDIEIKRLKARYPGRDLEPGQLIPYDDVESAAGIQRHTNRWQSVTGRWRRMMESEFGLIIGTEAGVGFVVLDDGAKLELAVQKTRESHRRARRAIIVGGLVNTDRLDEEQNKTYVHTVKAAASILAAAQLRGPVILPKM